MNNIAFASKLTSIQLNKVIEIAKKLGWNPSWLMMVINFESAGTFSPSVTNPKSGSVGLIQFTRDKAGVSYKTIGGKRYELNDIKKMSFLQQIDLVFEYYKPYKNKVNSFIDTYLATFFPLALQKSNDFVLQTSNLSASLIATQNPIFDLNKDKKITKGEILDYFKKRYPNEIQLTELTNLEVTTTSGTQIIENVLKWVVIPLALFFYSYVTLTL